MVLSARSALLECQDSAIKVKEFTKIGRRFCVARIFNSQKKRVLTIVVGTWGKYPYAHVIFNPSRLDAADWLHIEQWVLYVFDRPLKWLLHHGVVRRIEFYADLTGIEMETVVPITTRKIFRYDYTGKTSKTIYLGKRASAFSLAVYDKRQHLIDTNAPAPQHGLIRVEARMSFKSKTLRDLAEGNLVSPWDAIFILNPAALHRFCALYKATCLDEQLRQEGTLSTLNPYARKDMAARLPEFCTPQWRPEDTWAAQQAMLMLIFPDLGGRPYHLSD